jgi:hypothetical protein
MPVGDIDEQRGGASGPDDDVLDADAVLRRLHQDVAARLVVAYDTEECHGKAELADSYCLVRAFAAEQLVPLMDGRGLAGNRDVVDAQDEVATDLTHHHDRHQHIPLAFVAGTLRRPGEQPGTPGLQVGVVTA